MSVISQNIKRQLVEHGVLPSQTISDRMPEIMPPLPPGFPVPDECASTIGSILEARMPEFPICPLPPGFPVDECASTLVEAVVDSLSNLIF